MPKRRVPTGKPLTAAQKAQRKKAAIASASKRRASARKAMQAAYDKHGSGPEYQSAEKSWYKTQRRLDAHVRGTKPKTKTANNVQRAANKLSVAQYDLHPGAPQSQTAKFMGAKKALKSAKAAHGKSIVAARRKARSAK